MWQEKQYRRMKIYGQNNEDLIAFNYLSSVDIHSPIVLDIGANDGELYSNSKLFSDRGCIVHLVECSEKALERLREKYKDAKNVNIWPYAVIPEGMPITPFYESGSLVNRGDVALVSTFSIKEKERWPQMNYKEIDVNRITISELLNKIGPTKIDFLSIDVEGLDLEILKAFNLNEISCRIVCVENNGKNEGLFWSHMVQYGFRLLHKNAENLIFAR